MDSKDKSDLEKVVSDKSRRVKIHGSEAIVPLKFDKDGNIPTAPDQLVLKRLTLDDLRFLKIWRECAWDTVLALSKVNLEKDKAERLIKKLSCFRDEDAKVKALAEIPTPSWIAAKHVENVYNPTLEDSQHKSLAELAKIEGAYKQQNPTTQINVFNLPKMTPEAEAEIRKIADREADIVDTEAQVANG